MGDDAVDGGPVTTVIEASNGEDAVAKKDLNDVGVVLVPRPKDGLVREVKTNKIVSREQTDELVETEAVRHLGDFSDEVSENFNF